MVTEYLYVLDTGYVANKTLSSMTQLEKSDRAGYIDSTNTVSHLKLEVKNITYATSVSQQEESNIGQIQNNKTNVISSKNPVITINFFIDRDRTNDTYEYGFINQLLKLEKTQSLKLIYMITNGNDFINEIGKINIGGNFTSATPSDVNGTVAITKPYILGKFKGFNIGDTNASTYSGSVSFIREQ